jgi:CRISP-associated protein Cas1
VALSRHCGPPFHVQRHTSGWTSSVGADHFDIERPKVDQSILEFVKSRKFHAQNFVIRSEGVCRLNPAMARLVAQMVL